MDLAHLLGIGGQPSDKTPVENLEPQFLEILDAPDKILLFLNQPAGQNGIDGFQISPLSFFPRCWEDNLPTG
jgi:hypothetical protein